SFIFLFFQALLALRVFHSFPTRRSSDLMLSRRSRTSMGTSPRMARSRTALQRPSAEIISSSGRENTKWRRSVVRKGTRFSTEKRSEEHTSELQSRSDLVCRLLLEKKKKK